MLYQFGAGGSYHTLLQHSGLRLVIKERLYEFYVHGRWAPAPYYYQHIFQEYMVL